MHTNSQSVRLFVLLTSTFLVDAAHSETRTGDILKVELSGTVVDSSGEYLGGAQIDAVVLSRRPPDHPLAGSTFATVVGQTATNAEGHFRLIVDRARNDADIAWELFAYAEGHAVSLRYLEEDETSQEAHFRLRKQKILRGRLVGPTGEPVANVSIGVRSMRSTAVGDDNSFPFSTPPADISAWPPIAISHNDGEFEMLGLAPEMEVDLAIDDMRLGRQRWLIDLSEPDNPILLQASPPRAIEGIVLTAGERLPQPGADVVITFWDKDQFEGQCHVATDTQGRFELRPMVCDELGIRVSISDSSYQQLIRRIPWPRGTLIQRMTLPVYVAGTSPEDGTTADGRSVSRIVVDVPSVDMIESTPALVLEEELSGTMYATGEITPIDAEKAVSGIVAIDIASGQWQLLIADAMNPRVSRSGNRLAFTSRSDHSLRVVRLGGDLNSETVTDGRCESVVWMTNDRGYLANFSAPAIRHYYGEEYWGQETEKWHVDHKGIRIEQFRFPALFHAYDLSSDGTLVALGCDTHCSETGAQVFTAHLDGTGFHPVARRRFHYYWDPRFSPDSKTILAKHLDAQDGLPTVNVIALDGSYERSIVVNSEFSAESACWSPDGRHIAIAAYDNSAFSGGARSTKLFVVDVEGEHIKEVSLANAKEYRLNQIDWSGVRAKFRNVP